MLRRLAPLGLLAIALLIIAGYSWQQSNAQQVKKYTGRLPNNWGKLGLSVQQKQAIYKIQFDHGKKIEDLEAQIAKLEQDERQAMVNVLTPLQVEALKKIYLNKTGIPFDLEKKKASKLTPTERTPQ